MTAIEIVNVVLAGAALLMALALSAVYWRNHNEIRSPFTAGLLLFAAFLVVHNAVVLYHFFTMMGTGGLGTLAIIENVLQVAALGALLVATLR